MNKFELLDFQKKVVEKAIPALNGKHSFIFQAPTGTGKTFITANIINKFIETTTNDKKYTFLHFSPSTGGLNDQNALKIESYKKLANLRRYDTWKLNSTNQMNITHFKENVVHFFGWAQLIKKTNTITNKENERDDFWSVYKKTLKKEIRIVIIIDEQHLNKNAKSTDEFLDIINNIYKDYFFGEEPIKLEMSATIKDKNDNKEKGIDHIVKYHEAVREEIVKKNIIINSDMSFDEKINDEELLIHSALDKREEVIRAYNKRNLQKKGRYPLVVIQLPDKKGTQGDLSLSIENISKYVLSHKNTHKNHVAVWVSGRHSTLSDVKINKQDVETNEDIHVLIFKQAVATGWDIPRANIWIKLRNNMDKTFEIQTLGRVLRNQFRKYYNNELIDNAFIYTNDEKIKSAIDEEHPTISSGKLKIIKKKENIIEDKNDKLVIVDYKENEIVLSDVWEPIFNKIKELKSFKLIKDEIMKDSNLDVWESSLSMGGTVKLEKDIDLKKYTQKGIETVTLLTLYKRYILFKNSIKIDVVLTILNKIFDIWGEESPTEGNIKRAYRYFYEAKEGVRELEDGILKIYRDEINKRNILQKRTFQFKNEILLNKEFIDFEKISEDGFDQGFLYKTSLKLKEKKDTFDSRIERIFYNELINENSKINKEIKVEYFVYNNVNEKYYYYISYVDTKIKKYFPDFIISTKKSIYILDTKSISDNNTIYGNGSAIKMKAFNELLNKEKIIGSETNKEVYFGYVSYDNGNFFYLSDSNEYYKKPLLEFFNERQ